MLTEIQQVLRLVMILAKKRRRCCLKNAGGLLVLLWTETGDSVQSLNCTVAAAGPWCRGIQMKALQPDLRDLEESMLPRAWPCPPPDPEELFAFTDLYGPPRLLLSFQMNARLLRPECCSHLEAFLHTFSVSNAGIKIQLRFSLNQRIVQRDFRVKTTSRVALANQPSLIFDVTCSTEPPEWVKTGGWCLGGHPVLGGRLPLSIPPEAMDQGLFGELSVQPVTLLSPCVLQYPNLPTQLTHIKVLVCSPSNVPVTGPSTFLQNLPAHLDCRELGLHGLRCSSYKDLVHSGGTVYTVEQENYEDSEQASSPPQAQQRLLLFLFLQYNDPFTCQLNDIMATEVLIERHLEAILNNNRKAVTAALQTELKDTLKVQNCRKKDQEKLRTAAEVIISSSISIVSCSSNMDFRNACLNRMKVRDTHELSASLRKSLWRVTSWKFIPKSKCYTAQMEEHPESDELTRAEI